MWKSPRTRTVIGGCAVAILLATFFSSDPQAEQTSPDKQEPVATGASFFDGFDRFNGGRWFIADGWSNGSFQSCRWRKRNVAIRDGKLLFKIDLEPAPAPGQEATIHDRKFNCAELQTRERFGFGVYETAFSAASSPGIVTAMFTYTGPGISPGDPHDEIDFEVLGKNTNEVQLNYYVNGRGQNGMIVPFGYDNAERMARMAFVWRPESMRWYIDGKLVREVVATADKPIPQTPGKLMMSLWSGQGRDVENWLGGAFAPTRLPLTASYDYVAYTRFGEPCQFPESIVCDNPDP